MPLQSCENEVLQKHAFAQPSSEYPEEKYPLTAGLRALPDFLGTQDKSCEFFTDHSACPGSECWEQVVRSSCAAILELNSGCDWKLKVCASGEGA